jgi:phage/conjugal plasmid C-4 type zinc finger TraR family protein
MDERYLEMAEQAAEAERQRAIDARVRYVGVSALECESCGDDIPEARRVAVPGCQACVHCQAIREATA